MGGLSNWPISDLHVSLVAQTGGAGVEKSPFQISTNRSEVVKNKMSIEHILPLHEAVTSRAVFVILSGSDGRADWRTGGNAFGASYVPQTNENGRI